MTGAAGVSPGAAIRSGRARVGSYVASDGRDQDVELAYDVFGTHGRPLMLVMGIGAQRVFWDDALCELLVAAGFQVVRFDHRDVGESTRLEAAIPAPVRTLVRGMLKLEVSAPYSLSHMAADVAGLMDALGWQRAHLVGVSMGGMIGQHLALEHGERVASLTAIMTTPGGRRYLPAPSALRALFSPAPASAAEAGEHAARLFEAIGSRAWPHERDRLRELGELAYARGASPRGFLRHWAALLRSGDRRARLHEVAVPTLVIHGSLDPLIPIGAGRRLASLVPRATWLPIAGMGHDLPPPLWPTFVQAIARHAARAEQAAC